MLEHINPKGSSVATIILNAEDASTLLSSLINAVLTKYEWPLADFLKAQHIIENLAALKEESDIESVPYQLVSEEIVQGITGDVNALELPEFQKGFVLAECLRTVIDSSTEWIKENKRMRIQRFRMETPQKIIRPSEQMINELGRTQTSNLKLI